jgi:apolipoprotein D and lipocalin family protein
MYSVFKLPKRNKTILSLFITLFFIIGCPQMMPPETVDFVDVERFTGVWYQIARYFNPAEGELAAVTAEYSLNDNGTLGVLNRGLVGGLDGDPVTIEGFARVVDTETNAKLAVSFTNPAVEGEFEFWIIELGEYYSYAVISNSMRSTLYIISRTPTMEESVYQGIIERLTMQGFDPDSIILTPQFDEMPPPETVDFVDIERYMGLWYEVARYPTPFDEDGVAVTAEYTLNEDGSVGILNSALAGGFEGDPTSIEGVAQVVDEETNAKLTITFDREDITGIEFSYWIIELDEDYQYAVVTNDTRFVLYILSRTPALEDTIYEDLLFRVVKKGFDADRLEPTPQLDE